MDSKALTLEAVRETPGLATVDVPLACGAQVTLRPLQLEDVDLLAEFLSGLSLRTRRFHAYPGYDPAAAQTFCEGLHRYDKVHLAAFMKADAAPAIIGVFTLGYDMVESEKWRYLEQGIELRPGHDCRVSVCLADAWQRKGVGSALFPHVAALARAMGQRRMILLGGVLVQNAVAVHFYRKHGFQTVRTFHDGDGQDCLDMILQLK